MPVCDNLKPMYRVEFEGSKGEKFSTDWTKDVHVALDTFRRIELVQKNVMVVGTMNITDDLRKMPLI